jgi:hypothetical protein
VLLLVGLIVPSGFYGAVGPERGFAPTQNLADSFQRISTSGPHVKHFSFSKQLGVVYRTSETICLEVQNDQLTPGTPVRIVILSPEQAILDGEVVRLDATYCAQSRLSGGNMTYFEIRVSRDSLLSSAPAIAIVGEAGSLSISRGQAGGDLDGDGRREYFRQCTSGEGVHLSVWTGKPLTGRRRWQAYFYLGYDVESTCTPRDNKITRY